MFGIKSAVDLNVSFRNCNTILLNKLQYLKNIMGL